MWFTFFWFDASIENIEKHGLATQDVEHVVNNARRPYPKISGKNYYVAGPTRSGVWIEVIFELDDETVVVFHARPLTVAEARKAQRAIRERKLK